MKKPVHFMVTFNGGAGTACGLSTLVRFVFDARPDKTTCISCQWSELWRNEAIKAGMKDQDLYPRRLRP